MTNALQIIKASPVLSHALEGAITELVERVSAGESLTRPVATEAIRRWMEEAVAQCEAALTEAPELLIDAACASLWNR